MCPSDETPIRLVLADTALVRPTPALEAWAALDAAPEAPAAELSMAALFEPPAALDAPVSFVARAAQVPEIAPVAPVLEPPELARAYRASLPKLPHVQGPDLGDVVFEVALGRPRRVDHRAWHGDVVEAQGARGTCWAFAGAAALEAAYARRGIRVKLSEHYLFHLSKAHENHRGGGSVNSLIGFQGATDVVQHLKYWPLPEYRHAPYIHQGALQALADSIPGTRGLLAGAAAAPMEPADWFEFDLRHIPLYARWQARYAVASSGVLQNFSDEDMKRTLAAGHDVVFAVPGHVMVAYGYDDAAGVWLVKNSQNKPVFQTLRYTNDPNFANVAGTQSAILRGRADFVTAVREPVTDWASMWIGRWACDHDGWRGRLVIRRYVAVHEQKGLPTPAAPISLGTWYGEQGQVREVLGGFTDGGRGLVAMIQGQRYELYLHGHYPYLAGGRTMWNGTWFGVTLSRGTATGAGSGFDRGETIGLWDMVHDGHRGQMRIGVEAHYQQAGDGVVRGATIAPAPVAHQVDVRVDIGTPGGQTFQLLHHTREDGVIGGVTQWGGRDWPVQARMSANLYVIRPGGDLFCYRHTGRYGRSFDWMPATRVGTGWDGFHAVFGGGDGVVYVIRHDGTLLWYYHDGRNQGTMSWQGPKVVGTGWNVFSRIFTGDGGVIYGVKPDGSLHWYRHLGRRDGSFAWEGPATVGVGWNAFVALAAGEDGILYGTLPDGRLLWYQHLGHDHGYPIWHGAVEVGSGWQGYDSIWPVRNGFLYGRNAAAELWLWRHHGFGHGGKDWTEGRKVGTGWSGPTVRGVFST